MLSKVLTFVIIHSSPSVFIGYLPIFDCWSTGNCSSLLKLKKIPLFCWFLRLRHSNSLFVCVFFQDPLTQIRWHKGESLDSWPKANNLNYLQWKILQKLLVFLQLILRFFEEFHLSWMLSWESSSIGELLMLRPFCFY